MCVLIPGIRNKGDGPLDGLPHGDEGNRVTLSIFIAVLDCIGVTDHGRVIRIRVWVGCLKVKFLVVDLDLPSLERLPLGSSEAAVPECVLITFPSGDVRHLAGAAVCVKLDGVVLCPNGGQCDVLQLHHFGIQQDLVFVLLGTC